MTEELLDSDDGIIAKFWNTKRAEQRTIFAQQFVNAL